MSDAIDRKLEAIRGGAAKAFPRDVSNVFIETTAVMLWLGRLKTLVGLIRPGSPVAGDEATWIETALGQLVVHYDAAAAALPGVRPKLFAASGGHSAHVEVLEMAEPLLPAARSNAPLAFWSDICDEVAQLPELDDPIYARRNQWEKRLETEAASTNSANTAKLFPEGLPDNPDIVDLVLRLNTAKGSKKSYNAIAREFTGETDKDDSKAQSLLTQIRRMKREGRVIL